jgi:hypothetical protein
VAPDLITGVSLKGTTGVSELRSTVSMAAPDIGRRAFVDPSGRKKELGGGLLARSMP